MMCIYTVYIHTHGIYFAIGIQWHELLCYIPGNLMIFFMGHTHTYIYIHMLTVTINFHVQYIWLVVWNIFYCPFHSVGNFIIPTDELHHFSEG